MEELLMCSVCIERYSEKQRHPVLLPRCGHSFCRSCVAMLISGGCITCPTCRTDQRIESAEKLPTEYTLLAIIHAQEHTKKETCERHSVKLSFWCRTCETSTCGECLFEDHPTHSHDVIRALKYIADMKIAAQEVAVKFMEVLDEREQIFYKIIFNSTKSISNALRNVNVLRKDMEDARELMKGIKEEESITAATSLSEAAKFLGLKWNIQDANFNRKQMEAEAKAEAAEKDEIDIAKEKAAKEMEEQRLKEKAENEALEAAAIAAIEEEDRIQKEKIKESKRLLRKSKTLSYIEMAKEAEKIKDGKGIKLKGIEAKLNEIENKKLIVELGLPEKKESKNEGKIGEDKKSLEESKSKDFPKSKEELKSTKEELKSAKEELRTAKEELKLLKEELEARKQEIKSLPKVGIKPSNSDELNTNLKEEAQSPKEEAQSSKEEAQSPKEEAQSPKEGVKALVKEKAQSSKEELKVSVQDEDKSLKDDLKVIVNDENKSLKEESTVPLKDEVKSPKVELKINLKEESKSLKVDLKSPPIEAKDGDNEFKEEKVPDLTAVKPKGKFTFKKTPNKTEQSPTEEKTSTKTVVEPLPIIKENEPVEEKLSEANDDYEDKAESLQEEDVKVSLPKDAGHEYNKNEQSPKTEQAPKTEQPTPTKIKDPFEDKFEVQEKLTDCIQVPGFMICVETADGRLAELEWGPQGLHVHCLQYTQVTYDIMIKCTMLNALIPSKSPIVFLELSAEHTIIGKVYIKLWGHLKRAHNFLSLCLGDQGTSYLNTKFLQVYNISSPGERMLGGDYEFNNGRGGRGLYDDMEWNGDYAMPMKAGMITAAGSGQASTNSLFLLCTQSDDSRNFSCPFGVVCEGLKVAKEAVQQTATKQVWISDCGVLIVPPKL